MYKHQHRKTMSCSAVAQMVSIMLYQKRFFPYYVFTILGGLDADGKGVVYSFDPVGSYERQQCRAGGSSASLIQPFLDNQVLFKNMKNAQFRYLSLDEALKLAKDAFTSATEREIHTGDYLEIYIITKDGITVQKSDLRKD
jgi:20S proteasome subunit beta 6